MKKNKFIFIILILFSINTADSYADIAKFMGKAVTPLSLLYIIPKLLNNKSLDIKLLLNNELILKLTKEDISKLLMNYSASISYYLLNRLSKKNNSDEESFNKCYKFLSSIFFISAKYDFVDLLSNGKYKNVLDASSLLLYLILFFKFCYEYDISNIPISREEPDAAPR